jgi:hypothetical protein
MERTETCVIMICMFALVTVIVMIMKIKSHFFSRQVK